MSGSRRPEEWVIEAGEALRGSVREASGREPEPSQASLDDRSVKMTQVGGSKGFDAGSLVKGRKDGSVLFLVDAPGLPAAVVVASA